jgi:site-specific recombinase XerD
MQTVPDEWHHRTDELRTTTITWEEACIVIFVASALQQTKPLAPRTISTYLSGVRKYLENEGVDTRFMNKSQYIRNTKQGLAQYYRAYTNRTTGDRERVPVTADMIRHYYATHAGNPTIAQQAVYTAMLIGFTAVARVSEYLQTPYATHLLTTDRVVFETDTGKLIPAYQVYKHPGVRVTAATLHIKSKKNDQAGTGFRYYFTIALPGETYCIVQSLWDYAMRARPVRGTSLFYIPSLDWTLKPPYFAEELRRLAVANGVDPTRVSSHSLRIGGATTLAAAGLNDHEIQGVGDWKSNSYLTYVRKNITLFEKARTALASPTAMNATAVRRMYGSTNSKA